MRPVRLALGLALAVAVAPGVMVRTPIDPRNVTAPVSIAPLDLQPRRYGGLVLERGWLLTSENDRFGGYSALLIRHGALIAVSDSGRMIAVRRRGGQLVEAEVSRFLNRGKPDKSGYDIESLTQDTATGQVWAAYEGSNTIRRLDSKLRVDAAVQPAAMADWQENAGGEAMVRLTDGRFLVFAEQPHAVFEYSHQVLLFSGDPTRPGVSVRSLRVDALPGYDPVDAAQLPDGRVLILLRRFDWPYPPRFSSAMMIADPADIGPGEAWPARELARFTPPFPHDNYEGMTVEADHQGRPAIWLISDDNFMHSQHTFVLKLRLATREKARRSPGTPQ